MKEVTLYMFAACPFCQRVLDFAAMHNIELEIKDVRENESFREELISLWGKKQVPFLRDEEADIQMYETADIIAYLEKKYLS